MYNVTIGYLDKDDVVDKILVTGGTGFIGSHTVIELIKAGYEPIILDNFYNSKPKVLERLKMITNKDITFYQGDIRNREDLRRVFKEHDIKGVIHFAGLKAVGESVQKPLEYYDNNVGGTLVLLEVMRECNVKNFVFSSSATVYGLANKNPIDETEPLKRSTNPYGQTKVDIEFICDDLYHSDNSWSLCMLRYFNPVGAHESGLIGEDPQGIPNNLMPFISQVAVGKREYLNIFGNDYPTKDGTGVRDYIHVVDLAKGHVCAVAHCFDKPNLYTYNLGTGNGLSVLDMVKAYSKTLGREVPYKFAPRRAGDVPMCYANPAKAERELGWKAEKTVEDMTNDSWNWQSKNPNGLND